MIHKITKKLTSLTLASAITALTCVTAAAAQDDRKGNAEFMLFNPAKGVWYTNSADGCAFTAIKWGLGTDMIVPGDYDGDGQMDAAVYRSETGAFYIRRSSDAKAEIINLSDGGKTLGDVPVPADFDGDGVTDIAVWRGSTGEWIARYSSKKKAAHPTFGVTADVPVPADYDGDGKADIAVFRPSENRWLIQRSSDGTIATFVLGNSGKDTLVPADYTGDGKADIAVYSAGRWTVLNSETGEVEPFVFGFADDVAAPGDYDGDGVADFAVYRKGKWYIHESGKPKLRTVDFGGEDDIPLAAAATKRSFSH